MCESMDWKAKRGGFGILWAIAVADGEVSCWDKQGNKKTANVNVRGGGFGFGGSLGTFDVEFNADCKSDLKGKTDNAWYVAVLWLGAGDTDGLAYPGGAYLWIHVESVD